MVCPGMTGDRGNGICEIVFMQFYIRFYAELCFRGKTGPMVVESSGENGEIRGKPYECLCGFVYPHKTCDEIMTFL